MEQTQNSPLLVLHTLRDTFGSESSENNHIILESKLSSQDRAKSPVPTMCGHHQKSTDRHSKLDVKYSFQPIFSGFSSIFPPKRQMRPATMGNMPGLVSPLFHSCLAMVPRCITCQLFYVCSEADIRVLMSSLVSSAVSFKATIFFDLRPDSFHFRSSLPLYFWWKSALSIFKTLFHSCCILWRLSCLLRAPLCTFGQKHVIPS